MYVIATAILMFTQSDQLEEKSAQMTSTFKRPFYTSKIMCIDAHCEGINNVQRQTRCFCI